MIKPLVLLLALSCCFSANSQGNSHNLIIGTYTNSCQSDGIYVYGFNSETGDFEFKSSTKNIINPSFVALSPDNKFVYCVNENGDNSQLSAFSYNPALGTLQFLNAESSHGNDPCHIITDNKNCIISNYSGGSIAVFGRNEDGSLTEVRQRFQHLGSSINKERQERSHMHQAVFSPDRNYVLFTDLGSDFIYTYKYHPEKEAEILEAYKVLKVKPGSGPRHLTFSADGKFVYLLQELDGTVSVFGFDKGVLKLIQESSVVSKSFKGNISAAEIRVSSDGKYLYATNRGEANTISCFEIKPNGRIKLKQTVGTLGKGPRSFTIDPTGKFLLVGNQYTGNIVVFRIDKASGLLTDSGKRLEQCAPVCLVFE